MHSLWTTRILAHMVGHLSSHPNTVIKDRRNRLCTANKAICNDVQCSQIILVTSSIRFRVMADNLVVCRMAKWLVDHLASNNRNRQECPRYSMTTMFRHKATQDICNLLGLASQIFAPRRIFELKISDQMALFIKDVRVENYWHQIEALTIHNVILKRHEEAFIFWKRELAIREIEERSKTQLTTTRTQRMQPVDKGWRHRAHETVHISIKEVVTSAWQMEMDKANSIMFQDPLEWTSLISPT